MKAIKNGILITKDAIVKDKVILYDRQIIGIEDSVDSNSVTEWLNASGNYVAPGFMDIHTHGAGGVDVMDGDAGAIIAISKSICAGGTTSFLPTTMTLPMPKIRQAMSAIREAISEQKGAARILGVHLEGPFISPSFKGAQDEAFILSPAVDPIREYLDIIKVITLAPELDHGSAFIREIRRYGPIVLSIGHSGATYDEALAAIEAGVCSATHIFNTMTGLHHRHPGVVGAALLSNIYCELIADTVTVHPAVFSLLRKLKGPDKLILITDAMRAAGMPNGEYELGGQPVTVSAGSARLKDGTLAGSVLQMNQAVRGYQKFTGCPLPEAVRAASLNPAVLLGWGDRKGSLAVGKDADFALLDHDLKVTATIVEGRLAYTKEKKKGLTGS
jgi:N-acetylglucosamine-6-phosphate deacetylase